MYIEEIKGKIAKLEEKIKSRNDFISSLIDKNNQDKLRLERLKLNLQAKVSEERLNLAKARPKSPKHGKRSVEYMSLDDCKNIGLYNRTVVFPVAKCKLHNCYLTYNDVRKRNCVFRMCRHMEWVNDSEER